VSVSDVSRVSLLYCFTSHSALPTYKTLYKRQCFSDNFKGKIELLATVRATVLRSADGVQIPLLYLQPLVCLCINSFQTADVTNQ
jgi:hypothetical protein